MPSVIIETDQPADTGTLVGEIVAAAGDHERYDRRPEGLVENLVPIVLFLAIAVTYCLKYYFSYRGRQDAQKTVRVALERGDPLTPDLLDRLVQAPAPKRTDLRRGVIGIGLGIGLGAFGFIVGEPDAVRPMLAVGLVPLLLGLAYLVLWRLGGDKA
ncbi:MAG: hypothetical protein E4H19_03170 [Chromatiales bacterium]|jgi:hypothetical protein|nr:MAG: hypothetical protein E4H19_03170 [Chromatiales bacterium]